MAEEPQVTRSQAGLVRMIITAAITVAGSWMSIRADLHAYIREELIEQTKEQANRIEQTLILDNLDHARRLRAYVDTMAGRQDARLDTLATWAEKVADRLDSGNVKTSNLVRALRARLPVTDF